MSTRGGHVLLTREIPRAGIDVLVRAGVSHAIVPGGEADHGGSPPAAAIRTALRDADVLLSLLTETVDRALLEGAPRLRGIANYAVGYNNIDIAAATELGVPVSNTPGALTETTADLTWALLLAVARRIPEAHAFMTSGHYHTWGPSMLLGADVGPGPDGERKTLGIIGYGRIGRAVARRARGFDMHVIVSNGARPVRIEPGDPARAVTIDELLERSDFVSLHVPLDDSTHHLIDAAALRRMKTTSYLINVARGPVVDEAALVRALQEGWIAGAGLDVYENEPTMAAGLASCTNAVLLPHIGSATHAARDRMAVIATTNALAHLRGERAPNCVNAEVYETAAYAARRPT